MNENSNQYRHRGQWWALSANTSQQKKSPQDSIRKGQGVVIAWVGLSHPTEATTTVEETNKDRELP